MANVGEESIHSFNKDLSIYHMSNTMLGVGGYK